MGSYKDTKQTHDTGRKHDGETHEDCFLGTCGHTDDRVFQLEEKMRRILRGEEQWDGR